MFMEERQQQIAAMIRDQGKITIAEIAAQYEEVLPEFGLRLQAKAGLTGYAQIHGKYNTIPYDKLMMDLMYIEDYSILRDVKLILKTVTVFFRKDSTDGFHTASSHSDDSIDALFEEKPVDKRLE